MALTQTDRQLLIKLVKALRRAERPVRILRNLAWSPQVREAFFRNNAEKLPVVQYKPFDATPVLQSLERIRRQIPDTFPYRQWLERLAKIIASAARLLATRGSPQFLDHSRQLYGLPGDSLLDGQRTALDLAATFDQAIDKLCHVDLGAPPDNRLDADAVADAMRRATARLFGDAAPEVFIVDELSANALAGSKRIRIRANARFNDKDVHQLIQHEAGIHIATALNGRQQTDLPMLAAAHPGTTKTQEGLAVFSEFITGSIDLDRLRRLADRVLAIQMAVDGADFVEVYRYYLQRIGQPKQAFESARRVFRGGVLKGGTPFTKDIVYLDGLIRVHNFLRTAVAEGRADCLQILFCGKMDLEDIPMLCELAVAGLVKPPAYRPDWASDQRFLIAYLAYSGFLNTIDLGAVREHYRERLRHAPRVVFPG